MRVIFDLGHPAHFHLFKHAIKLLKDSGNDIEIIAREKDCLIGLLDATGWTYHRVPRRRRTLCNTGLQTIKAFQMVISLAKRMKPDLMVGTSVIVAPAARLTGATSVIFNEDDAKVVPIFANLTYPLAHYIVTPDCLAYEDYGKKHVTYHGYHELAYLHPRVFQPNEAVFSELGITPGERYSLVRLVSLTAHHDIGHRGLSTTQAKAIVDRLRRYGRVFITAEKMVDTTLQKFLLPTPPDRIFHVLYYADLVVGDSQTMCAEAAMLGTASLRCNSFVGRISYLEELEHRYGLTSGILPKDFDKLLNKIDELLSNDELRQQCKERREKLLSECCELTPWILNLFSRLVNNNET